MCGELITDLESVAQSWIKYGWNEFNPELFRALHSDEFIDYDSESRASDIDSFIEGIKSLYRTFPDFRAVVSDLIIDNSSGKVAIRWTATGTHSQPFMGIAPTGRSVKFNGIEIIELREGLICGRWGQWDAIDILFQMSDSKLS